MDFLKLNAVDAGDAREQYLRLLSEGFGPEEEELERPLLEGSELAYHADRVYFAMADGRLAGGLHLLLDEAGRIAALSGMIVRKEFRHRGIAKRLLSMAAETADAAGVRATYLGTGNPAAASVYRSLGFQFAPGSNVMFRAGEDFRFERCIIKGDGQPEDMTPEMRLKIIPLALTRGQDVLMDANAGIVSTELMTQISCIGLYPKYEAIVRSGGRVVCLYGDGRELCAAATIKKNGERWFVDVMCAPGAEDMRQKMIEPLIDGERNLWARIAGRDENKQEFFAGLGFRKYGEFLPPEEKLPLETEIWKLPAAQA